MILGRPAYHGSALINAANPLALMKLPSATNLEESSSHANLGNLQQRRFQTAKRHSGFGAIRQVGALNRLMTFAHAMTAY